MQVFKRSSIDFRGQHHDSASTPESLQVFLARLTPFFYEQASQLLFGEVFG
jgi:hypothetical protein